MILTKDTSSPVYPVLLGRSLVKWTTPEGHERAKAKSEFAALHYCTRRRGERLSALEQKLGLEVKVLPSKLAERENALEEMLS